MFYSAIVGGQIWIKKLISANELTPKEDQTCEHRTNIRMDYEENASLLDRTMFSVVWQIDTFVSVPWSNNCLNVRKWRGSALLLSSLCLWMFNCLSGFTIQNVDLVKEFTK